MLRDGGKRRTGLAVVAAVLMAGLFGCATPSGQPEASPSSLVFGSTAIGATATADVVITNVAASGALTIESTGISGPDAAMFADQFDDDGAVTLDPGASSTVTVEFTPTAAGPRSATLQFNHSGPSPLNVPLSGTATSTDPGSTPLLAEPSSMSFPPTTVGQTASQVLVLRNGAVSGSLLIDATQMVGADVGMFSDDFDDEAPRALGPGESVSLAVTFTPTASGARTAALRVTHTGTNTPLDVPLTGNAAPSGEHTVLYRVDAGGPAVPGAAGSPAWSEDSLAVPSTYGNTAVAGNRVTTWTAPVDTTHPSVPAGTPTKIFQSERWDVAASPNLAYSFPVPAGLAVEARLYFGEMEPAAQVVGGRVFDVRVEGTTAIRDLDVFARVGANRGLMLAAPAVSDGSIDISFVAGVGNPAVKAVEIVTTSTDVPPWLAASPSSLDFASATLRQTSTQYVALTNVGGGGSLTVSSTAIAGPDAKMFADRFDDATPVSLGPGQSVTVPVVFLPTATGTRSARLSVTHSGASSPLVIPMTGTATTPTSTTNPPFGRSILSGTTVTAPTSLQFGPDGRLYVAQMDGSIKVLTVTRNAANNYAVTATETINLVRSLPNRNDNGTLNPSVTSRLVTGLLVAGTADHPQIYVVSSDPRIGAGTSGTDLDLDTNSGILSRLTRTASGWQKVDLVRGLPRSEENHTGNGLALDPAGNTLLIAYGGNTNKGAPSHNFANLPEFALSAAILSVDLDAIGNTTYDLPTLDDEDRPGTPDANDPFGGNNGKNQARLAPGGPVQVYSPGFRNPYDLVLTSSGSLYTIDNGGNAGWGGTPQPDSASGTCTNDLREGTDTDGDTLIRVTGRGFYGGHPNPTRASRANTFNATNAQSPVAAGDPIECDYRTEAERGAMASFAFSTNGLDEYTDSAFGNAMRGDLIAASHNDAIYRIQLSDDGSAVTSSTVLFSSAAQLPLDVTALGPDDPFPGTIWVADFLGNSVVAFEPEGFNCTGGDDVALDEDGDGFTNADEIDNGTNPCSPADRPPDADGDHLSDLNDPDDDNDGLQDTSDPFAVDAANGRSTSLPIVLTWDNDAPQAGGLLGLGFTGLMTNGSSNYATLYDPGRMTAGGAAGVVTVDEVTDGEALGTTNTQEYGFQFGIDADDTTSPFVIHTRLPAPFSGSSPSGDQSYGVFIGTGDQDNYLKLVVAANGGAGGFRLVNEQAGTPSTVAVSGPHWPGPSVVDLFLRVDPIAGTAQASYALDGAAPSAIGGLQSLPGSWFTGSTGPAIGLVSTSAGPAPPFPATWDFLAVQPAGVGSLPPSATIAVGAPALNSSTFTSGSFRITNSSAAGHQIASVRFDLSTSLLPDLVFDPDGSAGDTVAKGFTVDSNPGVGSIGHSYGGAHDGGFDVLSTTFTDFGPGETLTFSLDVDPTSIRGASAPGPGESGSVSGLELTGASVTVTYEDGTSQTGSLFRTAGSLGQSQIRLDGTSRPTPSLAVVGIASTPATVSQLNHVIRVSGTPGASVRLLATEAALFTGGLPGGGFDIDPYEANSVVAVTETAASIGPTGSVDIPVTLRSSVAGGGNNRFVAVIDASGATGPTSELVVLQLQP